MQRQISFSVLVLLWTSLPHALAAEEAPVDGEIRTDKIAAVVEQQVIDGRLFPSDSFTLDTNQAQHEVSLGADPNAAPVVHVAAAMLLQPVVEPPPAEPLGVSLSPPSLSQDLQLPNLFGGLTAPVSLTQTRRALAMAPGTDIVLGLEGNFRVTTEAGNLLGKSLSVRGVTVQSRTPIVSDPRIRGDRSGKLLASGSHWVPVRQDLDTALSKIDSRLVDDLLVIKGPYAVRYGPGFDFIDFQLLETPRYACGFDSNGSTSLEYKTNGQQWYGRTSAWGGSTDYGFRLDYGHRTGNDFDTGSAADGSFGEPESLPSSYKSRYVNFAYGHDFSPDSHLEFNYLRLDQTDVEFPGLVYDLDFLVTDGFELRYVETDRDNFDRVELEGWYNQTRMAGDTLRPGKNRQIPSLGFALQPASFPVPGYAVTDGDALSTGGRLALTWDRWDDIELTVGTDATVVKQELNDIEDSDGLGAFFPGPFNFPIPRSTSTDVGIFADATLRMTDRWTVSPGARVDFVSTDARDNVPGLRNNFDALNFFPDQTVSQRKQAGLEQSFTPWAVYLTSENKINRVWTGHAGVGYAERPPSLTELYTSGSFIGSLQPSLTRLDGDPELDSEKRIQFDIGFSADHGPLRFQANGYYAWIRDYITYDHVTAGLVPYNPGVDFQLTAFTNTDLATLAGFELYSDLAINRCLTAFASLSFVEGRDLSRSDPSRFGALLREQFFFGSAADPRSGLAGADHEALPGIPPFDSLLGLRWQDPARQPLWAVELTTRIVDNQDRIASSLSEQVTPGFTLWNVRAYAQLTSRMTVVAGVENFGDKFYREHLDYRPGRGVFQPGANFYFASQVEY